MHHKPFQLARVSLALAVVGGAGCSRSDQTSDNDGQGFQLILSEQVREDPLLRSAAERRWGKPRLVKQVGGETVIDWNMGEGESWREVIFSRFGGWDDESAAKVRAVCGTGWRECLGEVAGLKVEAGHRLWLSAEGTLMEFRQVVVFGLSLGVGGDLRLYSMAELSERIKRSGD